MLEKRSFILQSSYIFRLLVAFLQLQKLSKTPFLFQTILWSESGGCKSLPSQASYKMSNFNAKEHFQWLWWRYLLLILRSRFNFIAEFWKVRFEAGIWWFIILPVLQLGPWAEELRVEGPLLKRNDGKTGKYSSRWFLFALSLTEPSNIC